MYEKNGAHLKYFIPNIPFGTSTSVPMREIDIGAASATHGEFICVRPCRIKQFAFVLSGELAGGTSAAPTVVFKKHPTPLSATGQSTLATLTIPDATAIGKVVYKQITPASMSVGDSIEISWTVGTGTPTGMGFPFWLCEDMEETPANTSDMIASA